jgi:hypothetical protein
MTFRMTFRTTFRETLSSRQIALIVELVEKPVQKFPGAFGGDVAILVTAEAAFRRTSFEDLRSVLHDHVGKGTGLGSSQSPINPAAWSRPIAGSDNELSIIVRMLLMQAFKSTTVGLRC